MKSKRILIVTSEFPPQPGGIGNHAHHLAKHLQLQGMEVQVLTDQRSRDGIEEKDFDTTLNFKVHRISSQTFRFWMYLRRLQLLLKLLKTADVVIASGKFSLWAVAFSGLFYKRKLIAIIHGTEVNFKNPVIKTTIDIALKRFSKVIAVSNYTKSLVSHLKLKGVQVIPNGFDAQKWNSEDIKTIPLKGRPKLVTVGNVSERKGQLHVIQHLPELLKVFPGLHYHCIGIPTEKERFLEIAKTLEVDHHVTFHGAVDAIRLKSLVASSDLFVMLSSATKSGDVEGFGIAILEANALGLPAIGALGCGIEDAIADHQSGRLIAYDDSKAFINAMKEILLHSERYKDGAKAWALQHDWAKMVKRYVEVLNQMD